MLYQAAIGQNQDLQGFGNLEGLTLESLTPLLQFAAARLAAQPEQSDVIHDLLAYLAGQMIELNQHQQQRVEAFWLDVEGVTDAAVFPKLRHKGKQAAGLAQTAALAPFVNAASHSSRSLDESLAWDEAAYKAFIKALAGSVPNLSKLVPVYRQHAPEYRRLTHTLAATDRLIDRLVYQLYGLTEAEIASVEGTGKS
jgi:hypothetical protein